MHLLSKPIRKTWRSRIATEYCVRNTAEDLLKDGFAVYVLKDALAWVDSAGHEEALQAMEAEGIRLL